MEDRLLLTGQWPHADLPALYRSADVVLAVPWYEPFGITPLEAAACGRPLVGTAVGGLLDSVEDGVTGLLVPPRDVPALAAAVRRLLEDPETAAAMGARARARAVERFDWSVVAARTEAVLDATARGRAPASGLSWLDEHALEVERGMRSLVRQADVIRSWGERLATSLVAGGRLLAAGNGGSAAEAQHLTAELVGRWCTDRRPLSAISLCAETSSLTAILNDYGPDEVFARQVEAHGRPGDVLVLLSTSGTSSNVLHAAKRALDVGMRVWAMTGPGPNPLAGLATEAVVVDAPTTAAVQEVQLVAIHAVCAALDAALAAAGPHGGRPRLPAGLVSARQHVVVVGDCLLDRDVDGRVDRVCPDAPAPVVDVESVSSRPGRCGPHGAPVRRRRRRRHARRAARRRRRGTRAALAARGGRGAGGRAGPRGRHPGQEPAAGGGAVDRPHRHRRPRPPGRRAPPRGRCARSPRPTSCSCPATAGARPATPASARPSSAAHRAARWSGTRTPVAGTRCPAAPS